MELVLYLFLVQAPLGAFDIVYHHEITERLTWRRGAVKELRLHAARNLFYVVIFFSLAWIGWRGIYAWLFAAVLVAEQVLDQIVSADALHRLGPHTERVGDLARHLPIGVLVDYLRAE